MNQRNLPQHAYGHAFTRNTIFCRMIHDVNNTKSDTRKPTRTVRHKQRHKEQRQGERHTEQRHRRLAPLLTLWSLKVFPKATFTKLKNKIFVKVRPLLKTFTKMLPLPPLLTPWHVRPDLPLRCVKTAPWSRHKVLRLPQDWTIHQSKVPCPQRKNDPTTLTRS